MAEPFNGGDQTALPDSAEVFVVTPDGDRATIKRGDLNAAVKAGYRLETPEATRDVVEQQEYGDSPITAGLQGAARTITLGGSDVALRALGQGEDAAQYQKHNRAAAFGGELVGGIIGSAFGGVPAGLLSKAGAGAAAAVEGAGLTGAAARYLPTFVGGAAEGAGYGVGNAISKAALSDDPGSAESLLYDIGTGALLGGGLALGGKLLGEAASAGRQHVARIMTRAETKTGTIADDLLGTIAKEPKGQNPEVVGALRAEKRALKAEKRGLLAEAESDAVPALEGATAEAAPAVDVVEKFKTDYHSLDTAARQNVRQMEGLIAKGDARVTAELQQSAVELEAARREMRKFLPLEAERSYDVVDSGPRGGYANKQGKSLQTWKGDNAAIADAVKAPGFRDAIWHFESKLDDMQLQLGNKEYPTVLGTHAIFTNGELVAPLKAMPHPNAERLAVVNERMGQVDGMLSPASKQASMVEAAKTTVELAESAGLRVTPEQVLQAARDGGFPGLKSMADLPIDAQRIVEAQVYRRVASEMAKKVAPAASSSVMDIAGAAAGEWLLNGILGHGLSAIVGGKLGSLVKGTLGGIKGKLGEVAGAGVKRVAQGVDTFLAGAAMGAKRLPATTGAVLSQVTFDMPAKGVTDKPADKPKASTPFHERVEEMAKVLGDPDGARRKIHASLDGIRMADPMLADQMEDLAYRRLMFLGDKMPRNPQAGARLGKPTPWRPSDAEQAKWARYIRAAEGGAPTVLEDMKHGALTMESVETLETLYPATYDRLRADIVMRAGELKASLPWQARLTLSTLFKAPVDGILAPQSVIALQATFAPANDDTKIATGNQAPMSAPASTPAQAIAG